MLVPAISIPISVCVHVYVHVSVCVTHYYHNTEWHIFQFHAMGIGKYIQMSDQ